jgi:DNA topoisomerase I
MKIIVVESPTKARTISKILKIKTVATYGHLKDLPPKSFGIYFENGVFKGKYVFINRRKRNWFMKIKDLLEKAEEIYLATDPDREGEAIAYEIYEELKNKKIFRIRFHEITLKALRDGLKNKDKINENLVFAQKARRFLDRIIGYSLSPILWKAFKKNNLSAGRVQTAALYILVQREREIRNFKEKTYYHLKITIETKIGPRIVYLCEENKLKKIEENEKEDFENLLKNYKEIIFEKEKVNEKLIYPNPPLDTELMQRLAQKNLNFSPKKTMLLAQNLFEMGYITYHRTDSHYINKDFQLNLINFIKENYGHQYSWKPKLKKSKLSFEAHEAIRPTSLKVPSLTD